MIACAAFRALRMVPGRHRRWRLWSAARRRWLIKERDRRRASAAGQERLATGPPRRAVHARHSDALDEPDGASASPGSAHRRQQERSGSPFSASGLVPSGPGSPAAGSARPGVPASTCCIGATECPDPGGSNHGAEDSDWAPDRRVGAQLSKAPRIVGDPRLRPGRRVARPYTHTASRLARTPASAAYAALPRAR